MSSKIRLYFSSVIKSELISHLTKEQSYYVKSVMRLNPGDVFSVFNSQGEWNVKIENYQKKIANIRILKKVRDKENEKDIWLAFSPIKQNPLNFMIQKTTELGIQKFIPILSERTVVKKINIKRIKKIIVESSEQSNRISIPAISEIVALKSFLKSFPQNGRLIFCDINSDNNDLKNILLEKKNGPICILIGPEGDFSEKERQLIIEKKEAQSLSLANNILRAETAAISAASIVNFELN